MQGSPQEIKELPPNKPLHLRNAVCPYCGHFITDENRTRDHVIGRKFVPKKTLENQWNLILQACKACNSFKADLEDDISAITMTPDALGIYPSNHPQLASDAEYKAQKAISRRTRKKISESQEALKLTLPFGAGVSMTFNMISPAQLDQRRAFELAKLQFRAFFYFITYNEEEKNGRWWPGKFAPLQLMNKRDWGNDRATRFMETTSDWEPRFIGVTADGHFKVAIRKSPDADLWSLALEWNRSHRVIAACGAEAPLGQFLDTLPQPKMDAMKDKTGMTFSARAEKPLAEEHDTLFCSAQVD